MKIVSLVFTQQFKWVKKEIKMAGILYIRGQQGTLDSIYNKMNDIAVCKGFGGEFSKKTGYGYDPETVSLLVYEIRDELVLKSTEEIFKQNPNLSFEYFTMDEIQPSKITPPRWL